MYGEAWALAEEESGRGETAGGESVEGGMGPGLSHLFFANDLIVLSEACKEQLACIKEGLEAFVGVQDNGLILQNLHCSSLQM